MLIGQHSHRVYGATEGPSGTELSHIESRLCQPAQCAHAQRKSAAQYFHYSPRQASAVVTQDNRRFVGRLRPSIYSWIYHLSGWDASAGWWDHSYTTFNRHNCSTSVDLYFLFIYFFLQTCRFLRDYQMEFAAHEQCNCCNSGITRCEKKKKNLHVLMCAVCKGKVCTFKSAAAFCWSLSAEDRGTTAHARPLRGRSDSTHTKPSRCAFCNLNNMHERNVSGKPWLQHGFHLMLGGKKTLHRFSRRHPQSISYLWFLRVYMQTIGMPW